ALEADSMPRLLDQRLLAEVPEQFPRVLGRDIVLVLGAARAARGALDRQRPAPVLEAHAHRLPLLGRQVALAQARALRAPAPAFALHEELPLDLQAHAASLQKRRPSVLDIIDRSVY